MVVIDRFHCIGKPIGERNRGSMKKWYHRLLQCHTLRGSSNFIKIICEICTIHYQLFTFLSRIITNLCCSEDEYRFELIISIKLSRHRRSLFKMKRWKYPSTNSCILGSNIWINNFNSCNSKSYLNVLVQCLDIIVFAWQKSKSFKLVKICRRNKNNIQLRNRLQYTQWFVWIYIYKHIILFIYIHFIQCRKH